MEEVSFDDEDGDLKDKEVSIDLINSKLDRLHSKCVQLHPVLRKHISPLSSYFTLYDFIFAEIPLTPASPPE